MARVLSSKFGMQQNDAQIQLPCATPPIDRQAPLRQRGASLGWVSRFCIRRSSICQVFWARHRQVWCGQVAEWLKAADCKSARASVRWFESSPVHHQLIHEHPQKSIEIPENLGYCVLTGPP